jgi:hypothetical protein
MSFTNPKPLGWALREKLTSADLNAVLFAIQSGFTDELAARTAGDAFLQSEVDAANAEAMRAFGSRVLRLLLVDLTAVTPADTSAALGVLSTASKGVLVVKGNTNGVFRFLDISIASSGTVTVAAITSGVRALAQNPSSGRFLAVGIGGVKNAFSDNDGDTWTAGGAFGFGGNPIAAVWDGTDFIVLDNTSSVAHSTNGVAWTPCTGGFDPINFQANGTTSIALLGTTPFIAGATNTPSVAPVFTKSLDHGLTWAVVGSGVPNPSNYVASGGLGGIAGNGGSELYWLGNDGNSQLPLHVSTDGATWTIRSRLPALLVASTAVPRLLMCRDTGLLVAAVTELLGIVAVAVSKDQGRTWSAAFRYNLTSVDAIGLAKGKVFATIGAKLFMSAGWGA